MNRKTLLAAVGVYCATSCLPPIVRANPPGVDAVVFPTGEFPADVENVQAAVDQGGVVLLKATNVHDQPTAFNFGPPDFTGGGVDVETDVWILGEATRSQMTTIEGGVIPFFGLDGHVRIEAIHFDGPLLSAVIVIQSTGAEIVGNRITGVVPVDFGFTEARAIKFLANSLPITGTVVVADNVIQDMHPADFSDGIVFDRVEADALIEGNRIEEVEGTGIILISSRGAVTISDNFIVPGPGMLPDAIGNGIGIINNANVDTSGSSFEVSDNEVICENPFADGIWLAGNGVTIDAPVVASNHVTMQGSFFGGITLYGDVSHARVSNNRVDGDGAFALDIFALSPDDLADSNTFVGNNTSGFEAFFADLFLDAHTRDTVFVGRSGTVIDLGTGNQITGASKIGHGEPIGPHVKQAQLID
jgi:hypothetical protein